jgi:hypothetical protein
MLNVFLFKKKSAKKHVIKIIGLYLSAGMISI